MKIQAKNFLFVFWALIGCQSKEQKLVLGEWQSLPNVFGAYEVVEFTHTGMGKINRHDSKRLIDSQTFEYEITSKDSLRIIENGLGNNLFFRVIGDVLLLSGKRAPLVDGERKYFRVGSKTYAEALESSRRELNIAFSTHSEDFWSASSQWPPEAWKASEKWESFVWKILENWEPGQWKATTLPDFPWNETVNWKVDDWKNVKPVE